MYETNVVIFVGVIAGVVGLLLGAGLHRGVGSSAAKMRNLKKELQRAEEQNRDYQQNVADHFSETASLLNGLTRQYKNIHDHLATGADQLCRDNAGQSLLAGAAIELKIEERRADSTDETEQSQLQPPLDYAPKPGQAKTGTLSEEYGLEKVKLHEQSPAEPADTLAANATEAKGPPNLSTA
ncbi:MAG: YhcB family protein [Gammaproteobacteria bacterium]|nr:YhcB family protein [Gammaproteobacteria bacterium]